MNGIVVMLVAFSLGCGSDAEQGAGPGGDPDDVGGGECLLAEADIPEFEQTWGEAVASARAETCDQDSRLFAVALGECDTGLLIVSRSTGFSVVNAFYEAGTEDFVAVATGADFIDGGCSGGGYWPVDAECREADFTEFVCRSDGAE